MEQFGECNHHDVSKDNHEADDAEGDEAAHDSGVLEINVVKGRGAVVDPGAAHEDATVVSDGGKAAGCGGGLSDG
jgi:hypothetical protein